MSDPETQRLQLLEIQNRWLSLSEEQRKTLELITRDIHALGPKACRILAFQAERMAAGAVQGDFSDGRKWPKETLEETLDGLNYISAALIDLIESDSSK